MKLDKNINNQADQYKNSTYDSLYSFCQNKRINYIKLYKHIKINRKDIKLSRKNNGKQKKAILNQKKKTKYLPSKQILENLYYKQNKKYSEIGKILNISAPMVCYWFKKMGIKGKSHSQRIKEWMTKEHKEYYRKLAYEGKIGIFSRPFLHFHKNSKIELLFKKWCKKNNIKYKHQYQIKNKGHRYDFYLTEKNILVEIDGFYFHNTKKQKNRDELQEQHATNNGYKILRFSDKEIKKTKGLCFNNILENIKNEL